MPGMMLYVPLYFLELFPCFRMLVKQTFSFYQHLKSRQRWSQAPILLERPVTELDAPRNPLSVNCEPCNTLLLPRRNGILNLIHKHSRMYDPMLPRIPTYCQKFSENLILKNLSVKPT